MGIEEYDTSFYCLGGRNVFEKDLTFLGFTIEEIKPLTTTARELAEKIVDEYLHKPITDTNLYVLKHLVTEAILAAETRGRESVLSRVPSEDEFQGKYFQEHRDTPEGLYEWILAKLKEPT